ncbi:NADPH oxidase 4 [Holothuria leucospilota]|uniref:NADPH oxidase 4 n=1 Tax=Holothuria leucospilota TaxID=206669 RepID=A0A9Q0YQ37_HOLLE|nr:NADPH oxidase 4 [Holothuria leucospilota]
MGRSSEKPVSVRRTVPHTSCTYYQRMRNGHHIEVVFLVFWLFVNVAVFYATYQYYKHESKFFYLRDILGIGLCLSRGSASVLNLNSAALLLPMCRTILVKLRGSRVVSCNVK